jgi:hypothetical protein
VRLLLWRGKYKLTFLCSPLKKSYKRNGALGPFAAYFPAALQARPSEAGLKQARPTTLKNTPLIISPKGWGKDRKTNNSRKFNIGRKGK